MSWNLGVLQTCQRKDLTHLPVLFCSFAGLHAMKRSLWIIKQTTVVLFRFAIVLAVLPVTSLHADDTVRPAVVLTPEAAAIHSAGILFDGHNDLQWEVREKGNSSFDALDISMSQPSIHTDIPRLRKGGLKAQFWSVYVPAEHDKTGDALLQTLHQISIVKTMMQRYPETFEFASTADDIERIVKSGKVASMMGVEGGYSIEGELSNLQRLYDEGCRYMTLTHSRSLQWADSATDEPVCHGL